MPKPFDFGGIGQTTVADKSGTTPAFIPPTNPTPPEQIIADSQRSALESAASIPPAPKVSASVLFGGQPEPTPPPVDPEAAAKAFKAEKERLTDYIFKAQKASEAYALQSRIWDDVIGVAGVFDVFGNLNFTGKALGAVTGEALGRETQSGLSPTTEFWDTNPGKVDYKPGGPMWKEVATDTAQMAPGLLAAMGATAAGVPAPAAFGVHAFGSAASETAGSIPLGEGDNAPVIPDLGRASFAGVVGAGMPGAAQLSRQAVARAVAPMVEQGILKQSNSLLVKAAETLGEQVGLGVYFMGTSIPDMMLMDAEQRKELLVKNIASTLAMAPMSLPGLLPKATSQTAIKVAADRSAEFWKNKEAIVAINAKKPLGPEQPSEKQDMFSFAEDLDVLGRLASDYPQPGLLLGNGRNMTPQQLVFVRNRLNQIPEHMAELQRELGYGLSNESKLSIADTINKLRVEQQVLARNLSNALEERPAAPVEPAPAPPAPAPAGDTATPPVPPGDTVPGTAPVPAGTTDTTGTGDAPTTVSPAPKPERSVMPFDNTDDGGMAPVVFFGNRSDADNAAKGLRYLGWGDAVPKKTKDGWVVEHGQDGLLTEDAMTFDEQGNLKLDTNKLRYKPGSPEEALSWIDEHVSKAAQDEPVGAEPPKVTPLDELKDETPTPPPAKEPTQTDLDYGQGGEISRETWNLKGEVNRPPKPKPLWAMTPEEYAQQPMEVTAGRHQSKVVMEALRAGESVPKAVKDRYPETVNQFLLETSKAKKWQILRFFDNSNGQSEAEKLIRKVAGAKGVREGAPVLDNVPWMTMDDVVQDASERLYVALKNNWTPGPKSDINKFASTVVYRAIQSSLRTIERKNRLPLLRTTPEREGNDPMGFVESPDLTPEESGALQSIFKVVHEAVHGDPRVMEGVKPRQQQAYKKLADMLLRGGDIGSDAFTGAELQRLFGVDALETAKKYHADFTRKVALVLSEKGLDGEAYANLQEKLFANETARKLAAAFDEAQRRTLAGTQVNSKKAEIEVEMRKLMADQPEGAAPESPANPVKDEGIFAPTRADFIAVNQKRISMGLRPLDFWQTRGPVPGEAPKPAGKIKLNPRDYSGEIQKVFGVGKAEADAAVELADAMGIDLRAVKFVKGGRAKSDALYQVERLLSGEDPVPLFEGKGNLKAIAKWLQKYTKGKRITDVPLSRVSDEDFVAALVDHTVREVAAWDKVKGDYKGFYDEGVAAANAKLQEVSQERYGRKLSPDEIQLFHLLSTFGSPQATPVFDTQLGFKLLDRFIKRGVLSSRSDKKQATIWAEDENGKRYNTKEPKFDEQGRPVMAQASRTYARDSFENFQKVVKKLGSVQKAIEWMSSIQTPAEIERVIGKGIGWKGLKPHEYLDREHGGFGVFAVTGAKLGSYWLNRTGNFGTVTKDMWWARTMARLFGEKLTDSKGNPIKSPWGMTQEGVRYRELADKAWKIVADQLGEDPAMIQQYMWDLERKLYSKMGFRDDAGGILEGLMRGIETADPRGILKQEGKASVEFDAAGAVVRALKAPDISSVVHEFSHIWRRTRLNESGGFSKEDLRFAEQAFGVKNGNWTVAAEERFARGFERYLREGKAPNAKLAGLFDRFKEWLTDIYRKVTGSPISGKLTPQMRQVFDMAVTTKDRMSGEVPVDRGIGSRLRAKGKGQEFRGYRDEGGFLNLSILKSAAQMMTSFMQQGYSYGATASAMMRLFGRRIVRYLDAGWNAAKAIVTGSTPKGGTPPPGGSQPPGTPPPPVPPVPGTGMPAAETRKPGFMTLPRNWGMANYYRRANLPELGDAMDRNTDYFFRNQAAFTNAYETARSKMTSKEFNQAERELEQYVRIREQGYTTSAQRAAFKAWAAHYETTVSPGGRELIKALKETSRITGDEAARIGVQVQDGTTWRPLVNMGEDYYPRVMTPEFWRILSDPDKPANRAEYDQILNDVATQRGISVDEADQMLRSSASLYSSGDYFAGAEMARGVKLPDKYYDYSLEGHLGVLRRLAKRFAEIEAFGQETDTQKDLFQLSKERTRDTNLQRKLETDRQVTYGIREKTAAMEVAGALSNTTTITMLGGTLTAVRNFVQGQAMAAEQFGYTRALRESTKLLLEQGKATFKTLLNMSNGDFTKVNSASYEEARRVGIFKEALFDAMNTSHPTDSAFGRILSEVTRKALLVNSAAERFNRVSQLNMAKAWLEDTQALNAANPSGYRLTTRKAHLQRWGFEKAERDALIQGTANDALLERFYRRADREKQYSYTPAQDGYLLNTATGKFVMKFWKWGYQRAMDVDRNVMMPMFEKVDGQRSINLAPFIRWVVGIYGSAAASQYVRSAFSGNQQRSPSNEEVKAAFSEDRAAGMKALTDRLLQDFIYSSGAGILSDVAGATAEQVSRGRFKSPVQPAGVGLINQVLSIIVNSARRGEFVGDDMMKALEALPTFQQYKGLAKQGLRAIGQRPDWAQNMENRQLQSEIRKLAARFVDETGRTPDRPVNSVNRVVNPTTKVKDDYREAVMRGDRSKAWDIRAEFIKEASNKKYDTIYDRKKAIDASLESRHPLKVDGIRDDRDRREFMRWLQRRAPSRYEEISDLVRRYDSM